MAFSKIDLIFSRKVEIGESITFTFRDLDIPGSDILSDMTCQFVRQGKDQFAVATVNELHVSLLNYFDAFTVDYNSTNKFKLAAGYQVLTITAEKSNMEFLNFSSNAGVTADITNEPQVPTFKLDSLAYGQASANFCDNVRVIVDTTSPMVGISSPVFDNAINNSHYEFDWVRGATVFLRVYDDNSEIVQIINTPAFLIEPTVAITSTPTGANVTVSQQTNLSGNLYSLDNITFQNSNVFFGILPGSYTAYVKDVYGCTKQKAFTVTEFEEGTVPTIPVAFISNTNSLRFKTNEAWDNLTVYKNDENTLSSEEKVSLAYPYIQKYQNTDVVRTQLKTNYDTLTGKVTDCDGNISPILFHQLTNNLDKVDKRDGIGYTFTDGTDRFGYYFQSGNTYDPTQNPINIVNGTYELFGKTPSWAKVGQYVSVNGGAYYQVIDVVYVAAIQSDVIVISSALTDGTQILQATYNVFNWDAYEFDIDMGSFQNERIQIEVTFEDSNGEFPTVVKTSEFIETYDLLDDFITIQATNSFNNEIVYQEGMTHLLRLPFDSFGSSSESELEVEKTDQYVYSLDAKSYIKKTIVFNYLSTKMEQKVRQIMSLDEIKMNGLGYTVESMEEPERLGVTNLYKLTVVLYEVGEKPEGTLVDTNVDLDIVDVPALIVNNDEFIKYQ